ncbi:hypothetical protein J3R30DRAFT_1572618 [Lentinula aciculospora]|uniref:Uncharacterized protein n=1 Tax=Lentinula aciculospora TaxID=153920 RepID=A0A9W8ZZA0_9AGAR|nr:hypothetical protein J3R30DRAFT_1572618 [Lentinula aciculospora]
MLAFLFTFWVSRGFQLCLGLDVPYFIRLTSYYKQSSVLSFVTILVLVVFARRPPPTVRQCRRIRPEGKGCRRFSSSLVELWPNSCENFSGTLLLGGRTEHPWLVNVGRLLTNICLQPYTGTSSTLLRRKPILKHVVEEKNELSL